VTRFWNVLITDPVYRNSLHVSRYTVLAWTDIETGAYQAPELLKRYESKAEKLSLKESDRKTHSLKAIPAE